MNQLECVISSTIDIDALEAMMRHVHQEITAVMSLPAHLLQRVVLNDSRAHEARALMTVAPLLHTPGFDHDAVTCSL